MLLEGKKHTPKMFSALKLGGRFGYFLFFFCSGEGKGPWGSLRRWEGGGGLVFIENPRRGGFFRRGGVSQDGGGGARGTGRVSAGNWGGGAKYIFSGPKFPSRKTQVSQQAKTRCGVYRKACFRPENASQRIFGQKNRRGGSGEGLGVTQIIYVRIFPNI